MNERNRDRNRKLTTADLADAPPREEMPHGMDRTRPEPSRPMEERPVEQRPMEQRPMERPMDRDRPDLARPLEAGRTMDPERDLGHLRPDAPHLGEPGEGQMALFQEEELHHLRDRWDGIQTSFVDEPRKAVQEADNLVASTVQRLAESFANVRSGLERQWDRGEDVSTEELRVALQRYRSFFNRLLAW